MIECICLIKEGGKKGGREGIYLDHLLQKVVGNGNGGCGVTLHVGELLLQGLGIEEPREDVPGRRESKRRGAEVGKRQVLDFH